MIQSETIIKATAALEKEIEEDLKSPELTLEEAKAAIEDNIHEDSTGNE